MREREADGGFLRCLISCREPRAVLAGGQWFGRDVCRREETGSVADAKGTQGWFYAQECTHMYTFTLAHGSPSSASS